MIALALGAPLVYADSVDKVTSTGARWGGPSARGRRQAGMVHRISLAAVGDQAARSRRRRVRVGVRFRRCRPRTRSGSTRRRALRPGIRRRVSPARPRMRVATADVTGSCQPARFSPFPARASPRSCASVASSRSGSRSRYSPSPRSWSLAWALGDARVRPPRAPPLAGRRLGRRRRGRSHRATSLAIPSTTSGAAPTRG